MRKRSITFGLAAALALAGLGATPALADTPGGSGTVGVTGQVALSCGFSSSALGTLDFGSLAPGATTDPASLAYQVQCNDTSGYTVQVTDAGAKVMQNGTPVAIPPSGYTAKGTETPAGGAAPWPGSGSTPFTLDHSSTASTSPRSFTDTWTLNIPSTLFYPGALTDVITYQVFAQ
jgi:hypothetical protein